MLSLAVLGMAVYGLYSTGLGVTDLFDVFGLDWWADLMLIGLGLLLILASAFVRVLIPGGLALAASALLGLQALSLHNDVHFYGAILVLPQVVRGLLGAGLLAMAFAGARRATADDRGVEAGSASGEEGG